jgi:hypothetical protein
LRSLVAALQAFDPLHINANTPRTIKEEISVMPHQDIENPTMQRALLSLEGLSVGDAFGETFFLNWGIIGKMALAGRIPGPPYNFTDEMMRNFIARRELPTPGPWKWTDDTSMALSIVENLSLYGKIEPDELALSFSRHYQNGRGYGAAMHTLLPHLARQSWRIAAAELFNGQGSFGNGGAMRVAPIGAYFADDLEAVVENARLSTIVTHSHDEAAAGAIATGLLLLELHFSIWFCPTSRRVKCARASKNSALPKSGPSLKSWRLWGMAEVSALRIPCRSLSGASPNSREIMKRHCGSLSKHWVIAIPPAQWSAESSR